MALRLEIISAQREQLGKRARIILGDADCSIGRALDNDWALPDVSRYLSGHHATIHFRGGEYFLEDTSSNGTYVNDAVAPLGRRGTRALLHSGDVLRLGDYRILVHIDELPPPLTAPDPQTQADMTVESVKPLRDVRGRHVDEDESIDFSALVRTANPAATLQRMGTARQASDADLGDELTIESLLPGNGGRARPDPEPATRTMARSTASVTMHPEGSTVTQNFPEDNSDMDSTQIRAIERDRIARLRAAARARLEGTGSVPALDLRGALQAFCRGVGIDQGRLSMQDETQALQLAGRLLREALLGLKEILRAQQACMDHNGIECDAPEGRSPLDASTDEYLVELLVGHDRRRLDAVMQLRGQFAHARTHAAAIDAAMYSALQQFLAHLAPERMATGKDANTNWNRYKDVYGNLLQARDGHLPHLFLEALAQAYQDARTKSAG